MKKLLLSFVAATAILLAACGASEDDVANAKADATARGFTATGTTTDYGLWVYVTFGKCTGIISYRGGKATLTSEVPVPGTTDETSTSSVDDPRVKTLQTNPAFAHCFPEQ